MAKVKKISIFDSQGNKRINSIRYEKVIGGFRNGSHVGLHSGIGFCAIPAQFIFHGGEQCKDGLESSSYTGKRIHQFAGGGRFGFGGEYSFLNDKLSLGILSVTTFGLALKLGPLMVGTDYISLSDNSRLVNAYFGLSIPLGKK